VKSSRNIDGTPLAWCWARAAKHMLDQHMLMTHTSSSVTVIGTNEFETWFMALNDDESDAVARVVDMLEMYGTTLPFPYSSAIKGSTVALRELRVQSGGHPLRVIYAFDPARQAVLLIGGDKTGDARFYGRLVPQAERIWSRYLQEVGR
jgi:hypothetical protein